MVLRKMMELSDSPRNKAVPWLLIGAIFFAMRSCEYFKTAANEKKPTKIIKLCNITFKKNNKTLSHEAADLDSSNMVRIRFCY